MTATAGSTFAHDPCASDAYVSDAPLYSSNSPQMTALRPNLQPSPSPPPPVPLPRVSHSPPPSPGRRSSNRKKKVSPTQGDAVLIHYLDGGKRPDIAFKAGEEPLAGWVDDDDDCEEEEGEEDDDSALSSKSGYVGSDKMSPDPRVNHAGADLNFIAAGAVAAARAALALQPPNAETSPSASENARDVAAEQEAGSEDGAGHPQPRGQQHERQQESQPPPPQPPPNIQHTQLQPLQPRERDTAPKPGLAMPTMPITPYTPHGPPDFYSPRLPSASGLRHPDIMSPGIPTPSSHTNGELPPIMASPKSEAQGPSPLPPSLPSIRDQFRDLTEQHFPEKDANWHRPSLPHSPPGAGMPRMSIIPAGSPPISPNNSYGHPSPAYSIFSPHGYYTNGSGPPRPSLDYSSAASSHAETPGTDPLSTPATSITDRMSIDNMTNPQQGTFICKFSGCNAAPFQTQYLLNSHANVHSSARPHYCPVKGCPRAEGGKGFKRKNEMIRHGLVHESPGYVCPFCPDREHKYPRPDNLQRHVRVHHVDKDKDDPALRDVLSQRPDGPNRGRRRRGVP
ncbi:hypothetical protein JX265_009730 [Neoarthrinium moseri]|uniref:C2H2-type domain-containing protein n=1 Tax=Neoarthrinium moseri TaxID=1658444 RepID=A0A9Q0AMF4_9PEZI|nr:uncharacterized protein JN550_012136 [Neoarthrinium moseri]KAI1842311.1 hypothetical protein JX266_011479 [Neoarthrinium moseri]KAI1859216.1 hypothetical protein JN550_012136 [Neoarthrinium moseri]KAI1861111.1 hypothetical protein JX265_009730 [Neoarthrinium moseri]